MIEPKWPTVDEILEQRSWVATSEQRAASRAIEMCKAAYYANTDDPSKSPIGEVRRGPAPDNAMVVHYTTAPEGQALGWIALEHPNPSPNMLRFYKNAEVAGWRVLGQVPGLTHLTAPTFTGTPSQSATNGRGFAGGCA